MVRLIASLSHGVPPCAGRAAPPRADDETPCHPDVLAYFDRPGTSNGPTEAINGRLNTYAARRWASRNLTNYIARALLECAAARPSPLHL